MRSAVFTFAAYDRDGICAAQQRTGAGALVINGVLLDKPTTMVGVRRVSYLAAGVQRVVSLYSAGNLSAVTFTVAGYLKGVAVTEDVTGPNNSTVATTQLYDIVTSISTSATISSDVEVGNGATGKSNWYTADTFAFDPVTNIQANVTDTIQYDVNYTLDNPNTVTTPLETAVAAAMTNATTDQIAALTAPYAALRFNIDSSTDGSLVMTVIQAG